MKKFFSPLWKTGVVVLASQLIWSTSYSQPILCKLVGATAPAEKKLVSLIEHVDKNIQGMENAKTAILIGLLTNQPVLLEGPTGVAKTTLIRTFAKATKLDYQKIQNTPDLNVEEVRGGEVVDWSTKQRSFKEGSLLKGEFVFADELNRATPKLQASYLEAMSEKIITVDGVAKKVRDNFFFVAAQNPASSLEGNFSLTNAQKDRFLLSVSLRKPNRQQKRSYLLNPVKKIADLKDENRLSREELSVLQAKVENVEVDQVIVDKILDLVEQIEAFGGSGSGKELQNFNFESPSKSSTENSINVLNRAEESLLIAAKAQAFLQGRSKVEVEDLQYLAEMAIAHRTELKASAASMNKSLSEIIKEAQEEL